jgi:hypothetical protein
VVSPREYEVIGIVKMGLELGLLARKSDGDIVRVNISMVQALDQSNVEHAMAMAQLFGRGE